MWSARLYMSAALASRYFTVFPLLLAMFCLALINILTFHFLEFCDFEKGLCGYRQIPNNEDEFDWIQGGGSTSSRGTGPPADHTRGLSIG